MNAASVTASRHESELGLWENIERAPLEELRTHVLSYQGYLEDTPGAAERRHVPGTFVPLIIGFEAPLRHESLHVAPVEHQSFVAGLQDAPVISKNTGVSAGCR